MSAVQTSSRLKINWMTRPRSLCNSYISSHSYYCCFIKPIPSNGIAECVPYTEARTFNLTTVYKEDFGHHARQHSRWEDFSALTPTPSSGSQKRQPRVQAPVQPERPVPPQRPTAAAGDPASGPAEAKNLGGLPVWYPTALRTDARCTMNRKLHQQTGSATGGLDCAPTGNSGYGCDLGGPTRDILSTVQRSWCWDYGRRNGGTRVSGCGGSQGLRCWGTPRQATSLDPSTWAHAFVDSGHGLSCCESLWQPFHHRHVCCVGMEVGCRM